MLTASTKPFNKKEQINREGSWRRESQLIRVKISYVRKFHKNIELFEHIARIPPKACEKVYLYSSPPHPHPSSPVSLSIQDSFPGACCASV